MDNIIKKDVTRILSNFIEALEKRDGYTITHLSNQINHNSSIFQDEDSITLAVVVYSFSKIISRGKGKLEKSSIGFFKRAKDFLARDDYEGYRRSIKESIDYISKKDEQFGKYVLDVYNQAEIKKGSKLFYNGISLPRVAELMNISQWELMNYLGKTNIADAFGKDKRARKRLDYARELFRVVI